MDFSLLFELDPQGPFLSFPYVMGFFTLVLLAGIVNMILIRTSSESREVLMYKSKISSGLFYWALFGYALIIFRFNQVELLGSRLMWLVWLGLFIWYIIRKIRGFKNLSKLAARKAENKEKRKASKPKRDKYLTAYTKRKKKKKKRG